MRRRDQRFPCLACGYLTWVGFPPNEMTHEICDVCMWHDGSESANRGVWEWDYREQFVRGEVGFPLARPPRPEEVPPDGGALVGRGVELARGWAEAARCALETSDAPAGAEALQAVVARVEAFAQGPRPRTREEWIAELDELMAALGGARRTLSLPAAAARPLDELGRALARARIAVGGVAGADLETSLDLVIPAPFEPLPPRLRAAAAGDALVNAAMRVEETLDELGVEEPARDQLRLPEDPGGASLDDTLTDLYQDVNEYWWKQSSDLVRRLERWRDEGNARAGEEPLGDPTVVEGLEQALCLVVEVRGALADLFEPTA